MTKTLNARNFPVEIAAAEARLAGAQAVYDEFRRQFGNPNNLKAAEVSTFRAVANLVAHYEDMLGALKIAAAK